MNFNPHLPPLLHPGLSGSKTIRKFTTLFAVSSCSVHFDSLLKELLKMGSRVGAVKGELQNLLLFFASFRHKLFHGSHGGRGDRRQNL